MAKYGLIHSVYTVVFYTTYMYKCTCTTTYSNILREPHALIYMHVLSDLIASHISLWVRDSSWLFSSTDYHVYVAHDLQPVG